MSEPWFEAKRGQFHEKLFPYLKSLETNQKYRERESVQNLGLYEDREVMGVAPGIYVRPSATMETRVSLNVTGALCDTAANHISQTRPMAMGLTEGGDWLQQTKAKDLNHFLEGNYYALNVFDEMQSAFSDCTWNGTGLVYVDRDEDKIVVERVFPNELIVDDTLCEFSAPFEMHRRKYVPRQKLLRMFRDSPKKIEAIKKAKPVDLRGARASTQNSELIPLYTTWRLPTNVRGNTGDGRFKKKIKTDGLKVTFIEGCDLDSREYPKDFFPFVEMRWRRNPVGFWGRGIPSLGYRLQTDINKTIKNISRSVALCVPHLLLPTGSNINLEHLTNDVGSAIWHTPGSSPSWIQGNGMPEAAQHLQFMIGQYYQLIGISELAAGMKKPAGLDSGEAQRVYADTQADRFALPSQQYENASIGIAKRMIDAARDIAEEYGDYSITHQSTKGFRKISWSAIDLAEDEYTLKLWPINYLSKSPSDMIDEVNDLIKMGMLNSKQAKRLLPFPDLEGVMAQDNAAEELTQKVIEEIVEHDNYIPPDPVMDLAEAAKTVQLATLHYQTLGLPEEKLDMMRMWVANAVALGAPDPNAPPAPAQGAPMPAGLPPPAPGMAAPPPMLPS